MVKLRFGSLLLQIDRDGLKTFSTTNSDRGTQTYFSIHLLNTRRLLAMAWLRLVGSTKLQVSCTGYRLFYRALLQKRPVVYRSY